MSAEDEWMFDKSMGLLDATTPLVRRTTPEEYKAATGFNNVAEILSPKAESLKVDISALRKLQKELWPTPHGSGNGIKVKAKRLLTVIEVKIVLDCIEQNKLLTSMFSANMFGGYGMDIYEHENYPGTGPEFLFRITEYDLPKELNSKFNKASGGTGSIDAWNIFSKYTHSDQNIEWLKMYKMELPHDRSHYDY